ncbi:MAG: cysteine synthase family protein [Ignavibacteria bacterium]|nr:cysteine synthase family protein [Ignavibacteria bacterium]
MKFYNNVLELIGNTPLVKLNKVNKGLKPLILAKMESLNPGASVKDRIGWYMIEAAEKNGLLKPGSTIVEATSGNTGIGLALTAAVKGYKCIIVMTSKISMEKRNYLKALGAEVVIVPKEATPDSPDYYQNKAKSIADSIPNSFYTNQYENPNNPMIHYLTTGPEIWEATEGKITHFVAGIGTGGTISGTAKYLKEKNPNIKIIGTDPIGSVYKSYKETGKLSEIAPYLVEGVGSENITSIVYFDLIDKIVNVTDKDSILMCRRLTKEEGIFCGSSTGMIAYAALEEAKELDENAVIVFVVCDTGERYLTKYHNEDWLRENNII